MAESGGRQVRPETLAFIFGLVRDAPERQLHDLEALDAKMVQIFGAASIVIGLAGISDTNLDGSTAVKALLVGALIAYFATAVVSFIHLRLREFRRSLHADTLWNELWQRDVGEIQHALVADIAAAYDYNKQVLHEKGRTILAALVLAGIEIVLVGASITWSRVG